MKRAASLVIILLAGCDELQRRDSAHADGWLSEEPAISDGDDRQPYITDGSLDQGHPMVGVLQCGSAACSATLVGSRTVLTAGHCVPSSSATFRLGAQRFASAQIVRHPGYGGGNSNDLALVRLQQAVPSIAPSPLNATAPYVGESITLVGFGKTSETDQSFGVKRMAENTVARVGATTFSFSGTGNVCNGDSGGPTFVRSGDRELVAGVHSTKSGWCGTGGTDMRVDAFRAWIISTAAGDVADSATPPADPPTPPADPPTPPTAPPSTPAPPTASEGQSCATLTCATGLACVGVYSRATMSLVGRFCMERCTTLGADPVCDGSEVCTAASVGPVCFDPSSPSTGYTHSESTSPTPPPSPPPATPPPSSPPAGGSCGSTDESAVFNLLNQERAKQGLAALACDAKAVEVARAHSQDMCDRGYFSHYTPEGLSPWQRLSVGGVSFSAAGENIAAGYQTPGAVHAGWMGSAGHRQNMLTPSWTRVGIGLVRCNGTTPYWTEDFMR